MATKAQMIRREQRIQELMAQGVNRNNIVRIVADEEKITKPTVIKQYDQLLKDMQGLMQEQRGELRANLMARQEGIFQKAIEKGNLKTALEATNAQAKLAGLFEVEVDVPKRPETIIFKEKDFSKPLAVVPSQKVENE
jgi:uncharacterized protein YoaH (UPF0181 family)